MIDLRCGRAEDILTTLPDACCDALVSDPPAGVAFMGKDWDGHKGGRDQWIAWLAGIMSEARRVIKPGGYALVWALPRTSHWTAMALEDSGWTIRDSVAHMFGSGFPKSQSCLKPAHEVWWLAKAPGSLQPLQIDAVRVRLQGDEDLAAVKRGNIYGAHGIYGACENMTPPAMYKAAGRWPPNTLFSHVGGPDGCQPAGVRRVPADKRGQGRPRGTFPHSDDAWGNGHRAYTGAETAGDGTEAQQEYLCVEGCPVRLLDEQAGPRTSGAVSHRAGATITDNWRTSEGRTDTHRRANDKAWPATTGSASRFFPTFGPDPEDAVPFRYEPKASRAERNAGLDGLPEQPKDSVYGDGLNSATKVRTAQQRASGVNRGATANHHPTVKPLSLCRWLVRLIASPGALVLDPFAGSGSIGCAAVLEDCHYIGIELSEQYVAIAEKRLEWAHQEAERQRAPAPAHGKRGQPSCDRTGITQLSLPPDSPSPCLATDETA